MDEPTLFRDWDYDVSMIESLRRHLFEGGVVPLWNAEFCGGRPELALPHGMAFTWYSPLIYALPPVAALVAIWALMTGVGVAATYALLRRWTGSRYGAAVGAVLYAVNGYFAAHFNQGHVTFAFFHLVPVMILLFARWEDEGVRKGRQLALIALASFAFFTTGLPHALFYFYPAVLLYLALQVVRRPKRWLPALAAHGAGLLAAGYKLWPVVAWQLARPRKGVLEESLALGDVVMNTLRFETDFDTVFAQTFQNQVWFAWEYAAYLGIVPWVLATFAVVRLARRRQLRRAGVPFALLLAAAGVWLALGNGNPLSPAALFKHLPLLQGIRVFGRYQILLVLGLATLAAFALAQLADAMASRAGKRAVLAAAALATLGPPVAQAVTLALAIRSLPAEAVAQRVPLPPNDGVPKLAHQGFDVKEGMTYESYLLRRGYWIQDCYEPMDVERPRAEGPVTPVSDPEPARVRHGFAGLTLAYPADLARDVTLSLPAYAGMDASVPHAADGTGRWKFRAADLAGRELVLTPDLGPLKTGALATLVGVASALLLVWRQSSPCRKSPGD